MTYYCTSPRHTLVGPKKITCLKDGSYNAAPPACREAAAKKVKVPLAAPAVPSRPTGRPAPPEETPIKRVRRPFVPGRPRLPGAELRPAVVARPERPKIVSGRDEAAVEVFPPARPPIDNEIPDSANVQNSRAGADVPQPVQNESEKRQAKLNLGECQTAILPKRVFYVFGCYCMKHDPFSVLRNANCFN